jgi:hypothetical protein
MPRSTCFHRELILAKLSGFYRCTENIEKLRAIIDGRSRISLRLLDYFVTSFCKRHDVEIANTRFNVYGNYNIQLKAFSKHNFDPFRRRGRINYYYNATDKIETTIGQLNFFKWVIENGVLEYVESNIGAIEKDMTTCHKTVPAKGKAVELPAQNHHQISIIPEAHTVYFR